MDDLIEMFWEIFGEHLSLYFLFSKRPYSDKTHKILERLFFGIVVLVAISMLAGTMLFIANEQSTLGVCLIFGSIFYVLLVIALKIIWVFK